MRIGEQPHWRCGAPKGVAGSSPVPSASLVVSFSDIPKTLVRDVVRGLGLPVSLAFFFGWEPSLLGIVRVFGIDAIESFRPYVSQGIQIKKLHLHCWLLFFGDVPRAPAWSRSRGSMPRLGAGEPRRKR